MVKCSLTTVTMLQYVILVLAEDCRMPNGEVGKCISRFLCPGLLRAFANPFPGTEDYLRKFKCGNRSVCCGPPWDETSDKELSDRGKYCGLQHSDDYPSNNGTEAVLYEFPWLAAIMAIAVKTNQQDILCQGVLISNRYVITTAQISELRPEQTNITGVRLGAFHRRNKTGCVNDQRYKLEECSTAVDYGIERIIYHPFYEEEYNIDNIALIKLNQIVSYSVAHTTQAQHPSRPVSDLRRKFDYHLDIDLMRFMDDRLNYVISPINIKTTLAMVLVGARGNSASEIAAVLGVPSDDRDIYYSNEASAALEESANAVFISDAYHSSPEFEKGLRNFDGASVKHFSLVNGENTAALINRWVSTATHGHITEMVEPGNISADAALIFVSALYFKEKWTHGFDEHLTSARCFRNSRSNCIRVRMMQVSRIFKYKAMDDLAAQAVQLPYGDGEYAMLVIVPNEQNSVKRLISDLTLIHISNIVNTLEPVEVLVRLPRFNMQYTADLVVELQKLGIRDVFTQRANLSGIAQGRHLKINNVMHTARVEVYEKGVVDATVTKIDLISITGMELPQLNADRPFLFFIYHVPTNNIILEGRFNEPLDG